MKRILLIATLLLTPAISNADAWVNGYTRSNGTYVDGHYRSSPNSSRFDNYSSQGNTNIYTGTKGSQRNEFSNFPTYNTGRSHRRSNNPWGSK